MRRLVHLEQAEAADESDAKSVWGPAQRFVLLAAVFLLVAAALAGYLLQTWPTPPQTHFTDQQIRQQTETLTPLESLRVWEMLRRGTDMRPQRVDPRAYEQTRATKQFWLLVDVVLACAGAALLGMAMVKRRKGRVPQ
jgi:hypothetical protein